MLQIILLSVSTFLLATTPCVGQSKPQYRSPPISAYVSGIIFSREQSFVLSNPKLGAY